MRQFAPTRSALADFPAGKAPQQPTVTAVVPVYNEIEHIEAIVDALLAQDYAHLVAIYFIDGGSEDGTIAALQRLRVRNHRIELLSNPRRIQAAAINLGFARAQSDIVIRLDAHARYAPTVVRRSVEALLATGAGGVGAIQRPLPATTLVGQSIVAAHDSRFGIGVAQFRQASASGWVDTVWNGCYWKYVVDAIGPLREDLPRTEDNDFHARLRALGYGLYLVPAIEAFYQPRQSFGALAQQYRGNGKSVASTLFRNPQAVALRHLAPLALVVMLFGLLLFGTVWRPARRMLWALLLLYLGAAGYFSLLEWRKQPGAYVGLLPFTFALLHLSYGIGTLSGLARRGVE